MTRKFRRVPKDKKTGVPKKYPGLENPPATALDTRPSITGRVPQGQAYGDWLLDQNRELQIKTLGSEQKVKFFKTLANKKGSSGQKALRQIIRSDGIEKTLDQIKKEYKL